MRRYLTALAVLIAVGASIGRGHPLAATAPTTVVVSPGTLVPYTAADGWYFWNDFADSPTGSPSALVTGPASPPLGTGSVELGPLTTPSGSTGSATIATNKYFGTALADISGLSYSSYQSGPTLAISFQFDVRYRTTDTAYGGRLVFEPYQNGAVIVGSGWQSWSPLAGTWWASKTNVAGTGGAQVVALPAGNCAQGTPCTWAQINAAFPAAAIYGRTLLKAGSNWSGFDGEADALSITLPSGTTIYDFEPTCSTVCYVRTDGDDANTGLADTAADAKKTIQAAVDVVSSGGTVRVGPGTYQEQVDIGKKITLDGAGLASTTIKSPASLATKFTTSDPNKPVVYVHATGGTISDLTVDANGAGNANYRIEGIAYYNAAGTVDHVGIVHVRETPLNGNQHGVALYVNNADSVARTMTVTNDAISDYQKNGMALNGDGLTVDVGNNTVTGAGATPLTAQNGIQVGFGAVGSVHDNVVSGNFCTVIADCTADPTSALNADGAAGILLYTPGASTISVKDNTLTGNQFGVWSVGATSLNIDHNAISGAGGTGVAVWDCDQWCGPGDAKGTTGTIQNNTITGQTYGLLVRDIDNVVPFPAVTAHHNNVSGSLTDGAFANTAFDATNNWWGSANGPVHPSNTFNLGAQGDAVSDNVAFVPWWNAVYPAGASFAPVTDTLPVGSFASIQAGVNASSGGGTVNAAAGTFTENVTVGTEVTIAGAGQASTFVVPALSAPNPCAGSSLCGGAASNIVLVQANNVTLHDMTLDGNNPLSTSGLVVGGSDLDARNGVITNHNLGVYQNLTVHHVTVKNIYLRGVYASSGGSFDFNHDTVQNVQGEAASIAMFNFGGSGSFANNTVSNANDAISSNWSTGTTYLNNVVTASGSGVHTDNNGGLGGVADLIQGNNVSGCKIDGYGVWTFAPYVSPTVKENTVTGCAVGLAAAGQQAPATTTFQDNAVDGTGALVSSGGSTGVYVTTDLFGFGTSNVAATLTGNIIKNNGVGIDADSQAGYTTTINATRNSISGNGAGVVLTDTPTPPVVLGIGAFVLNMTQNWWGNVSGPAHALNPAGTGNSVPNGVVYSPWLGIGTDSSGSPGFQIASPMTWIAGPAVCGATCIQAAIDDASNGDTVKAKTGTFFEHVNVNKQITLTAGSNPIIDGGGSGNGITISVPNVTVSSFEVRNVTNGVVIAGGANNANVSANNIHAFHQRGVWIDAATGVLVDGNTIDGEAGGTTATAGSDPDTDLRYYGVFVVDAAGTVSNNVIKNITHGIANGTQSGVGIRVTARAGKSANMTINLNNLSNVQKNAMTITNVYGGTSVSANVTNNVLAGNGPITYIAQNGIQVSNGANAILSGNNVSGYDYAPPTCAPVVTVSCPAAAVGLLVLGAGTVSVGTNNVHNNMEGLYVQQTNGASVTGNQLTSNRDSAMFIYLSNGGTYSGNTVLGTSTSSGAYLYDASTGNTFTGNAFRNNDIGVAVDYTGAGAPTGNVFHNGCFAGNTTAGMATLGTQIGGPVNAQSNWWGKNNGANPPGHGDVIAPPATVDASLFLLAPVAGCPVPLDLDGDGLNDPSDNCPTVYNPDQANTHGELILLPKPVPIYNDVTNPIAVTIGDACNNDLDHDGVTNAQETLLGLSPYVSDTDGDRTNDGTEIACGSNPLSALSNLTGPDTDNDGLPNACELIYGTNPNNPDTDGDGVLDGWEVKYWMTNPLSKNTDGDGCTDNREISSLNQDHVVNSSDLQQLASHFGVLTPEFRDFDMNGDGRVNSADLLFMAKSFGPCTPS